MKIQVLQEDLSKALNITSRFASTKIQLPVLANVLFNSQKNRLVISATNLETSVSLSLGAKVEREGSITVPSRTITDLVSNLKSGQVSLSSEKEILKVVTSDFESSVSGMNASDFPSVPSEVGVGNCKIAGSDLQDGLTSTLFSVSTDETRPVLTGVLVIMRKEEIVLVSTDGFRLSQKKIKAGKFTDERKIIIPKSVLSELIRLSGEEDILFSYQKQNNQVIFGVSNIVLTSRIIEGDFPDFERIIPKEGKYKINLDKEEFLRVVKLASVFARDSANVVKIKLNEDSLEVLAESQQFGSQKARLDAKVEGSVSDDKFTIAFNYRFLEDFLSIVKGEDVRLELSEPNAPALFIDPKDLSYLHIIMPVRIQT